jgi:alkylhydroperoxidase family enzyme
VREAQIGALARWRSSKEFDAREKAALALAEAVTAGRVGERVYAEASKHFDHADYVELCLVAAFYAAVGRMIDALGVQLEPEMRNHSPRLPAK